VLGHPGDARIRERPGHLQAQQADLQTRLARGRN
jgi:hypothetical protein